MNDKCAAGTGRGMEVFADLLGIHINEVGEMSLQVAEEPPPVSSTCVVFAKSEAAGLLREGWPKEKVLAAYCSAMAHRVVTLLERIGVEKEFTITGGIAKTEESSTASPRKSTSCRSRPTWTPRSPGPWAARCSARRSTRKS
ncbi:MAG: BadF/BadG/BcrA/BcrD ATPase family protein, partial [Planctomycetota bacterium]